MSAGETRIERGSTQSIHVKGCSGALSRACGRKCFLQNGLSVNENKTGDLESQIRQLINKKTGEDLLIKIEVSNENDDTKIVLIDLMIAEFKYDEIIKEISEIANQFYNKKVIIRLRKYFDYS